MINERNLAFSTMVQLAKNTQIAVGKAIICPRCRKPGVLKIKEIVRKTKTYYALYVYHYDPSAKKITWHYYGKIKEGSS